MINPADLVAAVIPDNNKATWQLLAGQLELAFPFPPVKSDSAVAKMFRRLIWTPAFDYAQLTFGQLADVICSANYDKWVDAKNISSRYEVYVVIMAITVDRIGIDFYEVVQPGKTFTGDFGIS